MSHEIETSEEFQIDLQKAKDRFKILFGDETEEQNHTKEALMWEVLDFLQDHMTIGFLAGKKSGLDKAREVLNEYPARCKTCGKASPSLKLGDALQMHALGGECFECVSSHPSSAA